MTWELVIEHLERSPKAFTFWGRYRDLCVYLSGYNDALGDEFLRGFQGWLAARNPDERSLAYPGLVAREVLGDTFRTFDEVTDEQDEHLRSGLLDLLRRYREERGAEPPG